MILRTLLFYRTRTPVRELDSLTARQIGLAEILEGENASSKDLSREEQSKVLDAFTNTPRKAHKRFKEMAEATKYNPPAPRHQGFQICVKKLQMLQ